VNESEIGEVVLGCALRVHRALGPGLLESAYEACLCHELSKAGLSYDRQLVLPVSYDGVRIELGYRLDLLVGGLVIIEVKAVEQLTDVHRAQLLGYLRLGDKRLGYLLNFNVKLLKDGIVRIVNGL
jgi:GxxExxY protein